MKFSFPREVSRGGFWVGFALFVGVVFSMARSGPIGRNELPFALLYAASFILLFFLFKWFPHEWPLGKQYVFILSAAILCRFFFVSFPASYDVNRYIWEGYIYNHGFNPYLQAPDGPVLNPLVNDIWYHINHKDATSVYPPMIILLFGFLASVSHSPLFFKCIFILLDMAVILLLMGIAGSRNIKMSYVLIYSLNPLVLVFISGEGHLDAVQVFFICLCLYCFIQKKDGWGFFSLGCAVMSKYYAIILLPFVINSRNWKKSYAFMIPFVSCLPFLTSGAGLFSSLMKFGTTMHYNDSLAVLLRGAFGTHAVLVSILLLLTFLTFIFFVVHDPIKSSYMAIASLLLLIPTLHPWYLILITPFLVFFPSKAWLYLHFAVVFTFPVLWAEFYTGIFQEVHWLKLFEYIPFFILLIFDSFRHRWVSLPDVFEYTGGFSVVIPVLNESGNLAAALRSVRNEKGLLETIVVDGGSSDGSSITAKSLGAKVLESEKGRGFQIRAGVSQCKGDIILILHADCRIIPGTFERIREALGRNPQYIGGSLGMGYQIQSFKNRFLAVLNNLRARWIGISFGDQGQFFKKELLDKIGGFPGQMLMEDIELSLRLKEHGLLCHIPKGIVVSQRRWEHKGFWQNFKKVVTLCSIYLAKRRLGAGDPERREFYNRYYASENAFNPEPQTLNRSS